MFLQRMDTQRYRTETIYYIFLACPLLLNLLTTGKTNLDCWDNNAHCKTFVIFHDYEDLLYLREEELETEKQIEKEV